MSPDVERARAADDTGPGGSFWKCLDFRPCWYVVWGRTVRRRMLRDKEEGFYCSPDSSVMVMLGA